MLWGPCVHDVRDKLEEAQQSLKKSENIWGGWTFRNVSRLVLRENINKINQNTLYK